MRETRSTERGFTVTNIVVSIAIFAAIVGGVKLWKKIKADSEAKKIAFERADMIKKRFEQIIKYETAWKFTMNANENALGMSCLLNHNSCFDRGGPIALRDANNHFIFDSMLPSNGFSMDGGNCASFSDLGNEACPFRIDLSWKPNCEGTCIDPKTVKITGKLIFRPGQNSEFSHVKIPDVEFSETMPTIPGTPRTCYDHLLAGRKLDGVFMVQPDPASPGFAVHCDQNRDGGGWALVVSAPADKYSSFPDSDLLTPGTTGRLPKAKISAYLNASQFQNSNNLRFNLPDVNGGLVLAASTNGSVDGDSYRAPMTPGNCTSVPEALNIATHSPAKSFTLSFSGPGEAEVSEESTEKTGFLGFHICFGTDLLGQDCGHGCERKWNGSLVRQRGEIWIR